MSTFKIKSSANLLLISISVCPFRNFGDTIPDDDDDEEVRIDDGHPI